MQKVCKQCSEICGKGYLHTFDNAGHMAYGYMNWK